MTMKLASAFLLLVLSSVNGLTQPRSQTPRLEETVLTFYVGEFQRLVNVNPDVWAKTYPLLREFIQARFELSARRQEALQQLQMAVQRPKSNDDDIKKAIRDFDKADADIQANQQRFLSNVEPLLTPRQQGRVRIFQQRADQRIRQMLNSLRGSAPPAGSENK
jgi:hypothetical protein